MPLLTAKEFNQQAKQVIAAPAAITLPPEKEAVRVMRYFEHPDNVMGANRISCTINIVLAGVEKTLTVIDGRVTTDDDVVSKYLENAGYRTVRRAEEKI